MIMGVDALAAIHQEDHHIGFGNGLSRLARHFDQDAARGDRFETARIDHDEGVLAHTSLAIVAIPRESGNVRHQGSARARQAVEQGRFADIRAPDQRHDRLEARISHRHPPE